MVHWRGGSCLPSSRELVKGSLSKGNLSLCVGSRWLSGQFLSNDSYPVYRIAYQIITSLSSISPTHLNLIGGTNLTGTGFPSSFPGFHLGVSRTTRASASHSLEMPLRVATSLTRPSSSTTYVLYHYYYLLSYLR